ncbi:hypothetical protein NQ314_006390 [Rhamnusium bicolor]|uniref:Uncharacterized protein n=1 Tax=Rhamnusium bicolor TaxID=1586634 RepID=A0AAV8Z380_9CUCU|nr:hypothetical protein NQ314_006390 [Rhamnusium bicolor]
MTQDQSILLRANIKFFDTSTKISQILLNSQDLFIEYQTKLTQKFKKEINSPEEIGIYASRVLKSAVESIADDNMDCDNSGIDSKCKDIAKAFVKLAYFTRDQNNDELQGDFILYVLRAMKLNSLEAKQLFPCILMQSRLGSDYSRLFIIEVNLKQQSFKIFFNILIKIEYER